LNLDEITICRTSGKDLKTVHTLLKLSLLLYIQRINEIDKDGPALNSVIELNPDALTIAKELDAERKSGKSKRTYCMVFQF
jgi:amidase